MSFGPFVFARREPTTIDMLRALMEPHMTADESENAQAERELASLSTDDDPTPGAFYGHDTTDPEPDHA